MGNLCDKPGNCPCIPPGSTRKTVAQDARDQVDAVTSTQKKYQTTHGEPKPQRGLTIVEGMKLNQIAKTYSLLKVSGLGIWSWAIYWAFLKTGVAPSTPHMGRQGISAPLD